MTIGPLLMAIAATLIGVVAASPVGRDNLIGFVLAEVMPLLLTWAALMLIYLAVPNRLVPRTDAAIGAGVAALLLEGLRQGFAFYVRAMTSYSAIYGALAGVPVFLLWIYLVWAVVLAGAVVVVALPEWRLACRGRYHGPALKLAVGLEALAHLAASHRNGRAMPWEHIAAAVGVPDAVLLPVLEDLQRGRYVAATDRGQWILARDLHQVPLVQFIRYFGFGVGPVAEELKNAAVGGRLCRHLEQAVKAEENLLNISLARVIQEMDAAAEPTRTAKRAEIATGAAS
jgi:membrane protein